MDSVGAEQEQQQQEHSEMPPLQQPQPSKLPDQHFHLQSHSHSHSHHGHRTHARHHHSHSHRDKDKDGNSKVKVSGHRSTRYKEKFQVLRERYDRVIAIHEAHQRNLDIAASKMKQLQAENDLLLDSIYASSPQLLSLISPVPTLTQPFQPGRQPLPPPPATQQQQPTQELSPHHRHHSHSQHATPVVSHNTVDRRSNSSNNSHVYNHSNDVGHSHGRGHLREASNSSVQLAVPNGHAANGVAVAGGRRGSEDMIRVPSP